MSGILVVVLIFFALAGGLGAVAYFTYQKKLRRAKAIERGLKMVPILIHLPPQSSDTEAGTRDLREVMREKTSQAEVLYNLIAGTATDGFKSTFYGQRHIAFELIVSEGLVHFYAAVPVALVSVVKKAVLTAYPGARLDEVEDHNIFNQEGRLAATLGGEMVLRAESGYPIATYDQLERDPMEALLTTVSALEKTDGVAVQIMLRPAGQGWTKKAINLADGLRKGRHAQGGFTAMDLAKAAVKAPEARRDEERAKNGGGPDVSQLQLSQVERIEEKTKHPGFEVLVRVLVSTGSTVRSQQLLRDISTVFSLFENPGMNGFKFLPALDVQGLVTAFIFRFFPNELSSNVLNSAELATLFHLPDSQFTPSTNVERLQSKQVDGPVQLSSSGLIFGYNEFRGVKKEIRLSEEDRRRHTYILGQTGTGKSTMLENLAVQDMLAGNGFAFIDPHGDSAEKLLALVPKERAEDVIYFNPADTSYPLGLNLFEFKDPAQKDFLVQETINMLYKLYDPGRTGIIGPRYEHWYRNAALTLMSDPGGSTFIEIPKVFTDTDYLKHKFKYLKDPTVIDFWTKEMGQTSDFHKSEMLGWFVSKFGAFQNNEMMRNIIGQTKSSFDIRDVMDNKKILIVNLSKGRIGELNSQLLGMIFVIKFQAAAMSRADVPENERADFALYVDEFQNFSTDSFASILSEARKYRLNLIVANQFIGQLSNEIRDAVFGNIGTIVAHRMGPDDAEFMVKQFAPVFDASDLVNIPNYTAAMRLMIGGLPSQPFSIADSAPLGTPNAELGMAIKQLSAAKYGHAKAAVEADLLDRLSGHAAVPPTAPAAVVPVSAANVPAASLVQAAVAQVQTPAPVPLPATPAPNNPVAPMPVATAQIPQPIAVQPPVLAPPIVDPVTSLALNSAPAAAAMPLATAPNLATATLAVAPPPIGAPPVDVTSEEVSAVPQPNDPPAVFDPVRPQPAAAVIGNTPPPIGAPPVSLPPIGAPPIDLPPRISVPSATAINPAFAPPPTQPLDPQAAVDRVAQLAAAEIAREVAGPSAPAPIGAPPVSLPGTLSLHDITGGKPPRRSEPEPSPFDDIPLLAAPVSQPYYTGDGEPLEDDPYANIDVMGQVAPQLQQPDAGDSLPAPVQPSPAVGDGKPLDDDPYSGIDILGGARLAEPLELAELQPAELPEVRPLPQLMSAPVMSAPEPVTSSVRQPLYEATPSNIVAPAAEYVVIANEPPASEDFRTIAELAQQSSAQPVRDMRVPAPALEHVTSEPAIRESDYDEPDYQPRRAPERPMVSLAEPATVPALPTATSLSAQSATVAGVRTQAPSLIPVYAPAELQAAAPLGSVPDWSNAPEPLQTLQEVSAEPEPPQLAEPETTVEPLIHFLDPAAEKLLSEPEAPVLPEPEIRADGKPSLSGLPEGIQLIDSTVPENQLEAISPLSPVTVVVPEAAPPAPAPVVSVATAIAAPADSAMPGVVQAPDVPLANLEFLKSVADTLPEPMAEAALHGEIPESPNEVPSANLSETPAAENLSPSEPQPAVRLTEVSAKAAPGPAPLMSPATEIMPAAEDLPAAAPVVLPDPPQQQLANPTEQANEALEAEPAREVLANAKDEGLIAESSGEPLNTLKDSSVSLVEEAGSNLSAADSVKQAEHEIDDLLSDSLIHTDNTPGHHRLPEPLIAPSREEGEGMLGTPDVQPVTPGPSGEAHTTTHHGLKVIQPLEPIVSAKERFAAELAALNAVEINSAAPAATSNVERAISTVPPAAPQHLETQVTTPTPEPAVLSAVPETPKVVVDASEAAVPVVPPAAPVVTPVSLAPAPETVPKAVAPFAQENVNLPVAEMDAIKHDQAMVLSPNTVVSPSAQPASAPVAAVNAATASSEAFEAGGLPQAESLAANDVAKARAETQIFKDQAGPEVANVVKRPEVMEHAPIQIATEPDQADGATRGDFQTAAESTKQPMPRRRRHRGGRSGDKPAEMVASKEEAEHNTPSEAAREAAPLTGKLILPSGERPQPEPAQPQTPKPKKLAPGEVYVDDKGNVVIGE